MSCDAVTSSRATQLASTHGRWTFESQLACRVRRVGQRRMRDHEARISAPRRGAIATTWFTPAKVTEIGHKFCMVYSVVCPCAQPQGARPLRHRGRTGYCARCGRVTFIFRRKTLVLALVTIRVACTTATGPNLADCFCAASARSTFHQCSHRVVKKSHVIKQAARIDALPHGGRLDAGVLPTPHFLLLPMRPTYTVIPFQRSKFSTGCVHACLPSVFSCMMAPTAGFLERRPLRKGLPRLGHHGLALRTSWRSVPWTASRS